MEHILKIFAPKAKICKAEVVSLIRGKAKMIEIPKKKESLGRGQIILSNKEVRVARYTLRN